MGETFKDFLTQLEAGNVEPWIKSEPVPDNSAAGVKVAVAKNFDELVTKSEKMFWSSSMHLGADIVRNLLLSTMNWVRKWLRKLSRSLKWTLQPMTFLLSLMSRASPLFTDYLKAPRSQFLITEVGSWTTLLNTLLKMLLTS